MSRPTRACALPAPRPRRGFFGCAGLLLSSVALAVASAAQAARTPAAGGTGDPRSGEAIYARCAACHALAYDRTGPRHCGLFGRRAGTVPGFAYSDAMRRSGIVWTDATLDRFLENPPRAVPGTAMGYAGVHEGQERADLIAYLKQANASSACRR